MAYYNSKLGIDAPMDEHTETEINERVDRLTFVICRLS